MMLGAMTSDVRGRARLSSCPVGGSIRYSRRMPHGPPSRGLLRTSLLTYCASDDNPGLGAWRR
jgi:hypothetical protein